MVCWKDSWQPDGSQNTIVQRGRMGTRGSWLNKHVNPPAFFCSAEGDGLTFLPLLPPLRVGAWNREMLHRAPVLSASLTTGTKLLQLSLSVFRPRIPGRMLSGSLRVWHSLLTPPQWTGGQRRGAVATLSWSRGPPSDRGPGHSIFAHAVGR